MRGDKMYDTMRQKNPLRLKGNPVGFVMTVASAAFLIGCQNVEPSSNTTQVSSSAGNATKTLAETLKSHVVQLADTIGERNLDHHDSLCQTADYVENQFQQFGHKTSRQTFQVANLDCFNIVVEIPGKTRPTEIVIVGAHYDSARGTPGANDNGSGVAVLLAMAQRLADIRPDRTLRLVAFTNEEPPYFQTRDQMGSWQYARQCRRDKDDIVAVLSLETMGYYSDAKDSQHYPPPLNLQYPSTGNFIGFVANLESSQLMKQAIEVFQSNSKFPCEFAALPSSIPGVGWSDHWSFWQEGYLGIMITDTATFRYPHYHKATDTPDRLDYEKLAQVTEGLLPVVTTLTREADKADGTGNESEK